MTSTIFLRRIFSTVVLLCFVVTSIVPQAHAQAVSSNLIGLPIFLPKPGSMVSLSPSFEPVLIKGLKIHLENPFLFDFIVDPGDEKLNPPQFKISAQRMINYFMASLAVPEKDLWVNLSPVEKNHIIPDTLIKTELGRDLLAEDYMLKQISASLIYPENHLGKIFWDRVYGDAYQKFGATKIPVNLFNKVWILPQKASVYEKGNTVYIVNAHLKVMLEEDFLAQKLLGRKNQQIPPVKDITKEVLRQVVLPAIEKEVNEDKNFAPLRQIFYALILAQWYQDVFKESVINKYYSGQEKISGIDVGDPQNKERIYQQYLTAYKRGVFNYIKEEIDGRTQQPIPRKYFSGGFVGTKVERNAASADDFAMAVVGRSDLALSVELDPSETIEPRAVWNDLNRPRAIVVELEELFDRRNRLKNPQTFYALLRKYSLQLEHQTLYPVQGAWPFLKAVALLPKVQQAALVKAIRQNEEFIGANRPELADKILLMENIYDSTTWLSQRAPHLIGRRIYLTAAEIHYWAGGLGPVMKFHGKGMKDLGADVCYIEPWYQLRRDKGNPNGDPLNYTDSDIGIRDLNEDFDEFDVEVGEENGTNYRSVHVKVARGIDQNGIRVYMFRDVQEDGSSFYTRMLYSYRGLNNPVTAEESMTFLNIASAELIKRLEDKRRKQEAAAWKPAIVHTNDGQYAPLEAVMKSRYGSDESVKNIFWAFTTHTYGNRNRDKNVDWRINVFLKHMLGIKNRYIDAFRAADMVDYTSGGIRLADWVGTVSDKHRDDVSAYDPLVTEVAVTNGAVPEEMAAIFREEFGKLKAEGKISDDADYLRPTAEQIRLTKMACKERLNAAGIKTANGGALKVDIDNPMIGYSRRLVGEKAGRQRAFSNESIWTLVQLGYNVVIFGANQGGPDDELTNGLRKLESEIAEVKARMPWHIPGTFQFVSAFTALEKKLFLAANDIQIQDSDNHTGAAEFSEEDSTANASYQGGASFREGVIVDQGIPWDPQHPGIGQTLIPSEDTTQGWISSVYRPLIELWHKDPDHENFYKNATLSPLLNRVQGYRITSATYLREYDHTIARLERQTQEDQEAQLKIVQALGNDVETIKGILSLGRNGVKKPFIFNVWGQGFPAPNKGLTGFLEEKKIWEDRLGYDIFFGAYMNGYFQAYLRELFEHTGSAADVIDEWTGNLKDDPNESTQDKILRFSQFLEGLVLELQHQLSELDAAQITPGGIKLDHIDLQRQGFLTTININNQPWVKNISDAQGLYGVIKGIAPIIDLRSFLQS